MRDEHGVVAREQAGMNGWLVLEYVEAGGGDLTFLKGLDEGLFVYDRAA